MEKISNDQWESRFFGYFHSLGPLSDGSHDLSHFQRVWRVARAISREEGGAGSGGADDGPGNGRAGIGEAGNGSAADDGPGNDGAADELILLTAAYFHDLVSLPKNHPERKEASRLSAERTVHLLKERWNDFPDEKLEGVRHAIHAHSFSAQVAALTKEAKILQDADRMEAVGAIGLARVWYTAGQLNASLFDPADPLAERREPDDRKYALDHFQLKLLRLPAMMNTATGRRMAEARADYLREFLRTICVEILGS